MTLITTLAWIALPALAGSGALSQVSDPGDSDQLGGKTKFVWNGEPIAEDDFAVLQPDSDGTLRVPVVTKAGMIDPFWKLEPASFFDQPIEAGKAPSLSVGSADAKTQVIISKPDSEGRLSSKKFEIAGSMRKLQMRIIGNGDMTSTYVRLLVSIDGKAPIGWSQQAPTSARTFERVEWDLSKVLERAAGKGVTAQIEIVDGNKAQFIGIGETSSTAGGGLAINNIAANRAFFTFPNLFLGPNLRPYPDYQALIRDGESYAKYFGIKSVNSQKNFGMPKEDMYAVLVEVNKLVASQQYDHNPSNWKQLPMRLTDASFEVAVKKAMEFGNELSDPTYRAEFEYFVKLRAIQEWFTTRFKYDNDIASGRAPRIDFRETMRSPQPRGVCGDISWGIVQFAAMAGLKNVYKIEGDDKRPDGASQNFGHSWNAAVLPSGSVVFTDPTRNYYSIDFDFRQRMGITFSPFGFGLEEWNTGFFLLYYHNQTIIGGTKERGDVNPVFITPHSTRNGTKDGVDYFTQQNWSSWINLSTPSSFTNACSHYFYAGKAK